ncbi:MAG: peptidoglycan-associated lipoprotein Pal [Desulfuromonadales bacterium]|nr:peptidoglycan-associated lipoprotein Pal [Desulfuromonadales bacterium]
MKQYQLLSLTLILSLIVLLSACSKKPVMDAESVPAPVISEAPAETTPATGTAVSALGTVTGSQLEPVYFDYDSHALSQNARQALERNVALFRQESGLIVTIEGHCDERGSDEYNLALGEQRAAAVKNYLVTAGVAATRLNLISYGEERPAVAGNDDAAWSRNRRAAFN